ncbi:unnamed protein product [Lactuca virosa]|uniref:Uncharacterized protein n=2 Tax=Lactuca virosa TaxID=75947 RepID=A0AAU9MLB4_9ASTR|nr:unnamed protein product [Lactuca virosa]
MVSRKKDSLNDNVDKVDFMVNSRDHPIEIDDDEVSEEEKFQSGEVKKENYLSDSDFEVRSITRSRKLVNRSDKKFSKRIVYEHDFSSDSDFEDGISSSVKRMDKIADKKVKKKWREDVNRVLGLHMGVDQLNGVDVRGNEEWYETWKDQFKKPLSLITPTDIVYKIIERCEADMVFVASFIILVCTCFGSCNKQEEKLIWSRSDMKTFFNGPSVFLTLLYVDRIQCKQMLMVRRYPVINHWTLEQLKVREINEIANGGFGTPSATVKSVDEVSRGSILKFHAEMKWCLIDMSKKLDKAFKKHGNLKIIEFYGLKVKELCSAYKAFRHSNSKCESTFESYDKSSSCDDKFAEIRNFGQSIKNSVGSNKSGVANDFGKSGCIETKLHVDCEGVHKKKCVFEDIPSFNLGIEDDIYTPRKVNTGVDSYVSKNSVSVGISSSSVKGNVI